MRRHVIYALAAIITVQPSIAQTGKPCTKATYYVMQPGGNNQYGYTIATESKEVQQERRTCSESRAILHGGDPKVMGKKLLLDVSCSPCGPMRMQDAMIIAGNLYRWRILMKEEMRLAFQKRAKEKNERKNND